MYLLSSYDELTKIQTPTIVTIGNFDGVHLGHSAILEKVVKLAVSPLSSLVITFSNHPSTILSKNPPVPLLTTLAHKIKLFNEKKIDYCLLLPFTKEFASQSAEQFLKTLSQFLKISHLVLGHDATIGKNREGGKEEIQLLAKSLDFSLTYCPEYTLEGSISSSTIRKLISSGNLEEARKKLGRPWSIFGEVIPGAGRGKELGFPTANIDASLLVIPPKGVYTAWALGAFGKKRALVNLGLAPTFGKRPAPVLETFIPDLNENLYGQPIEVIFDRFIRSEMSFSSKEALKSQIIKDLREISFELPDT